ncbi:MAG TPA: hypothetical protein VN698_07095 [Bacteroidia bacterium]|nr:hypothetical protein [Bacteroidia bacterium]
MKTIKISKISIDVAKYKNQYAKSTDYNTFITESCIINPDNGVPMLYLKLDDKTNLYPVCESIKYHKGRRFGGTNTRGFGFVPRKAAKDDYCNYAAMEFYFPNQHKEFINNAKALLNYYEEYCPIGYYFHKKMPSLKSHKFFDEYKLKDTNFTSGVVNDTLQLPYHYDRGNIPNTISMMLTLKNNVSGGYLSLPEYSLGIELSNNSLFCFLGQNTLHGVTPIKKHSKYAKRYTVVYFSSDGMRECDTITKELEREQNKKSFNANKN